MIPLLLLTILVVVWGIGAYIYNRINKLPTKRNKSIGDLFEGIVIGAFLLSGVIQVAFMIGGR